MSSCRQGSSEVAGCKVLLFLFSYVCARFQSIPYQDCMYYVIA